MKRLLVALVLAGFSIQVSAASCATTAANKKLAGAAKESFLKKCSADAKTNCEVAAKEKKLSGAAQSSYVKKCVSDATSS